MATDLSAFKGKKRKLLEYMMDPENRHMSVTDVCEALGISRTYFYQCLKDERFNATLNDVKNRCFSRYLARVDRKVSEKAAEGDQRMAKLFYEVQGMVGSKGANQTVNIANQAPTELEFDSTEEALAAAYAERDKLNEIIADFERIIEAESRSRIDGHVADEPETARQDAR